LTRRPGVEVETANDRSGLFFTRVDESYSEVQREETVDEHAFSELVPAHGIVIRNRDYTFRFKPIRGHFLSLITMSHTYRLMALSTLPTPVATTPH